MSLLLQAIINFTPKLTPENLNEPDSVGGYEFGTWGFPPYLDYFEKVVGHKIKTDKHGVTLTGRFLTLHQFTKKEKKIIANDIKKKLDGKTHHKMVKGIKYISLHLPKNDYYNLEIGVKWTKRLLKIFSTTGKTVWYGA